MNYLLLLVGAHLALMNSEKAGISYDLKDWKAFTNEHEKRYESKEVETMRRSIFHYNKHQIDQFNKLNSSEAGFSLDLNHLADVSQVEMRALNGFRLPRGGRLEGNNPETESFLSSILDDESVEVPNEVDWRSSPGRVSRVKNQGNCGSCWAFSAVGALEGQEAVRRGAGKTNWTASDLIELSEQNLVDCTSSDYGCRGGSMADAFDLVKSEGGIDDEASYPYEGRERQCRFKKDKVAITDQGHAILPEGDEQKLKEVVAKFGPVAVAIDASSIFFQFYRGGVYYNRNCKKLSDQLNHGVLVVGYGTDPRKGDYWIVKNSWGPRFGEHGYIRMARNRGNNCGIATTATIPTFV